MSAAAQKRNPTAWRSPERRAAPSPSSTSARAVAASGFSVAAPPAAPDAPPIQLSPDNAQHLDSHDDALHQAAVLREAARSFASPQPSSATREGAQNRREARRRARGAHRPLRVAWTHFVCGAALLGQVVLLLWLHGRALSASHRADKLDVEIAAKQNLIGRAQERIASLDASPQLTQWAAERGWRRADHKDFDDATKTLPPVSDASPASEMPVDVVPEVVPENADQSTLTPGTLTPDSTAGESAEKESSENETPKSNVVAPARRFVGEAP